MTSKASAEQSPAIVWFRRDLRLADNHALAAAVSRGGPVIPVFILEKDGEMALPYGGAQSWWLHHSLAALGRSIADRGGTLVLRSGDPTVILNALVAETGATAVYWNRRHDPLGMETDAALKVTLKDMGLEVRSFAGQLLHDPSRLKTASGGPYRVYTPFWRALGAGGEPDTPIDTPETIMRPDALPASEALDDWQLLPKAPDWASEFAEHWTPGEAGALDRLNAFTQDPITDYKQARDLPGIDGTSRLSPHLAFGEISPATVWHATRDQAAAEDTSGVVTFRKELVWRDFSYHLLFHNPELDRTNLNNRFDAFPWKRDPAALDAWTRGMTGYPIVDAGMRQLWRHGYMHNRVRMIAASFLIKHLMIDWREGEAWFRDTLLDADPASNAASWQWVAGCGADAAPFFRIFNPILQGERFDADGSYVRRFVPEIAALPDKFLHKPFEAPEAVLREAGITLGQTYPKPLVDHSVARNRAMAAFTQIKDAA